MSANGSYDGAFDGETTLGDVVPCAATREIARTLREMDETELVYWWSGKSVVAVEAEALTPEMIDAAREADRVIGDLRTEGNRNKSVAFVVERP